MRSLPCLRIAIPFGLALAVSAPPAVADAPAEPAQPYTAPAPVIPEEVVMGQVIGLEPLAEMNDEDYKLFKTGERYLDLNYIFASPDGQGTAHGGGAAFGYYWTSLFATQVDILAYNSQTSDVFYSGGVNFRLPIDSAALALHIYLGGGYQDGTEDAFNLQIGGGFEVRLTDHTGFVADVRGIEPRNARASTVYRFGLRVLF